jgi:ribosomal protein S18 acetylase RimI-like enzyme
MIIRVAEPGEYAAIGALTVKAYRDDGQLDGEHGYESTLVDVAARAQAGEVLVAIGDGGAVLGGVTLVRPGSRYAELSAEGEFEFRMLAVDPAAKGRGVGRALVRACIERAEAASAKAVVILVRDFAVRAQRLYEHFGFVRTPELDMVPYPGVNLLALRLPLT